MAGAAPASGAFIFFRGSGPTEIYTLSLHDALPISPHTRGAPAPRASRRRRARPARRTRTGPARRDRKSTRLNSSHRCISYAVFCLKKKKASEHAGDEVVGKAQHSAAGQAEGRGAEG